MDALVHKKREEGTTAAATDAAALGRFQELFKRPAEFVVRAPGRANIIGEHIDYNGYSVLPFALQQGTIIYCAAAEGEDTTVRLASPNEELFSQASFSAVDPSFDYKAYHHWSNYVRAGFLAVQELYEKQTGKKRGDRKWKGADLFVVGTVPFVTLFTATTTENSSHILAFFLLRQLAFQALAPLSWPQAWRPSKSTI